MNIHTQSLSTIEAEVLENLQKAASVAPRLPIACMGRERITPQAAIEQIQMGTIHPAVFETLCGKYSASLSLAA